MHEFVSLNHRFFSVENAFLRAVSSAALHGKGIFTTVVIHNSIAFRWEQHWRRLTADARTVGVNLTEFSEAAVIKSVDETIKKNNFASGRARLTFFDETPSLIWQANAEPKTNLLIQTGELRPAPDNHRLTISPFRINSTSPLAGVKSCNYLENILALNDARAKGFDEAIRLNEKGKVTSACLANVFWVKSGVIYTPPLATGCLEGTTRSFILENFTVEERTTDLLELIEADAIFLTSAGIGVVSGELEGSRYEI